MTSKDLTFSATNGKGTSLEGFVIAWLLKVSAKVTRIVNSICHSHTKSTPTRDISHLIVYRHITTHALTMPLVFIIDDRYTKPYAYVAITYWITFALLLSFIIGCIALVYSHIPNPQTHTPAFQPMEHEDSIRLDRREVAITSSQRPETQSPWGQWWTHLQVLHRSDSLSLHPLDFHHVSQSFHDRFICTQPRSFSI